MEFGKVPDDFLLDHKIVIPKPFKDHYHSCKSYRPVTLESIIGKTFIRIIHNRLQWFLESNNLISATQDAYRHDQSCNDLVLRLVQTIQEAWNRGETLVLAAIDFDSYFETIWREKLINKLYNIGIRGSIVKVLESYICHRQHRFSINSFTSEWIASTIGLSQGGILSTLLTNLYSTGSDTSIDNKHGEFADDNFKWECHENEHVAAASLQDRLNDFYRWSSDHNAKLSNSKIHILFFRPPTAPRPYNKIDIMINNSIIKEVDQLRIIGTILDTGLTFVPHFNTVIKSSYSKLNRIKSFVIKKRVPKLISILRVYKCLLRSRLDFSTAAIANVSNDSLAKLTTFQRQCLLFATGCVKSTSLEALNLVCNIQPIDLHMKLKVAEASIKIKSKTTPINKLYQHWSTKRNSEKYLSTFTKLSLATKQINKGRHTEQKVLPNVIWDTEEPPFVDSNIVLQRRQTKEEQLQHVMFLLNNNPYDFIICTDGSTLKVSSSSLGQTGASAAIYKESIENKPTIVTEGVDILSHNYVGELKAIELGLKYIQNLGVSNRQILILTDCIPAINMSFTNIIVKDYAPIIKANRKIVRALQGNNNNIVSTWIPGHSGFLGNEAADKGAKEAAARARKRSTNADRKVCIIQLKEQILTNWQFRINIELSTNRAVSINSAAGKWILPGLNQKYAKHLLRFATGQHSLGASEIRWNPHCETSACKCGNLETFHHYVYQCDQYEVSRYSLLNKINLTSNVQYARLYDVPLNKLFGQDILLTKKQNEELSTALVTFIEETGRFN